MQALMVVLIVIASAAYAAWVLMPKAWQRALSRKLLRREPASGGGCGGCGGCDAAAPPRVQTITVHRRPPAG
jgi:hypothetical protein